MECDAWQPQLSLYVDGRLHAEERARLEQHMAGCTSCRATLDGLQRMVQMLRSLERPPAPDLREAVRERLTSTPWWHVIAARFFTPWPASLPLHGLALATTALLVVMLVNVPRYVGQPEEAKQTRSPMMSQVEPSFDRAGKVRSEDARRASTSGQYEAYQAGPMARREEVAFEHMAGLAQKLSVSSRQPVVGKMVMADQATLSSSTAQSIGHPLGSFEAVADVALEETRRSAVEHPLHVRWKVKDPQQALTALQAWVSAKQGALATVDAIHLDVRIPEVEIFAFLDAFSNVPLEPTDLTAAPYPATDPWGQSLMVGASSAAFSDQSSPSAPAVRMWVAIQLELVLE